MKWICHRCCGLRWLCPFLQVPLGQGSPDLLQPTVQPGTKKTSPPALDPVTFNLKPGTRNLQPETWYLFFPGKNRRRPLHNESTPMVRVLSMPEMVFGHNLQHMAPFAMLTTAFCMVFRGAFLIFSGSGARFSRALGPPLGCLSPLIRRRSTS